MSSKAYIVMIEDAYYVIKADSLAEAKEEADGMNGYILHEAKPHEYYEDENSINYMGELT